jgi:hypothetical protein
MACIRTEWGSPADEGLPYESREGGWQGAVIDSWDLLDRNGLYATNDKLQEAINDALQDDEWCEVNPFSLRTEQTLYFGWKAFANFVMHEARYVFLNATPKSYDPLQHDEMHPVGVLSALARTVESIGLVGTLETSVEIYRVHIVDQAAEGMTTAKRLGAPPRAHATYPNRMSPAGISMFYGAFDLRTSILETYNSEEDKLKQKVAAYGIFSPSRTLHVLDLTKPLVVPSIFDAAKHSVRPMVKFLIDFLKDFTKPVPKDKYAHVEYVPTQVVTEYFRHIFTAESGHQLDGIIYPSSKQGGQAAVVLFADNNDCIEASEAASSDAMLVLKFHGFSDLNNPVI